MYLSVIVKEAILQHLGVVGRNMYGNKIRRIV